MELWYGVFGKGGEVSTDSDALDEHVKNQKIEARQLQKIVEIMHMQQSILESIQQELTFMRTTYIPYKEKCVREKSGYSTLQKGSYMADYIMDKNGNVIDVHNDWVEF